MKLEEKTVTVRVKNPEGRNYDPIRYKNVERMVIDQPYGNERMEEQDKARDKRNIKWRVMSPQTQLKELDKRLGNGAGAKKQRARIMAAIQKLEETSKKKAK